jgi:subtilisin family serine protease
MNRSTFIAIFCFLALAIAHASHAEVRNITGEPVVSAIANSGKARVMIVFDLPASASRVDSAELRTQIRASAEEIVNSLPAKSYFVHHRYDNIAALALDIDAHALHALQNLENVKRIDLDEGGIGAMNTAAPLARVSNVRDRGYNGTGVKVAVIDSGIRLDHPDFAGRIIAQQCYCSSNTAGVGCCPNGSPTQSGAGSAADGNGHGTNVSGIIAGNGGTAPKGGSPNVDIVAIRTLDNNNSFCCSSDVVAAMDWVASQHTDTDVVNLSLGTSALFAGSCDSSTAWSIAMSQAAAALTANGTVITASAGNQGDATSVSAPACLTNVIALGAVWSANFGSRTALGCTDSVTAADLPTCFSNSGNRIALYAPGAYVTSTGRTAATSTYAGTSQASPLTASCIADLKQVKPTLTPSEARAALVASPTRVVDPKNGMSFPRLDCADALIRIDRIFASGFEP